MTFLAKYWTTLLALSLILMCAAVAFIFASTQYTQPNTDISQPHFTLTIVVNPEKIRLTNSFTVKAWIHAEPAFDKSDYLSESFNYNGHDLKWMDYQLTAPDAEVMATSPRYTFSLHPDPRQPGVDGPYPVVWTIVPRNGGPYNATVAVVDRWDHTDSRDSNYHSHYVAQRTIVVNVVPPVPWTDMLSAIGKVLGTGGVVGLVSAFLGWRKRST